MDAGVVAQRQPRAVHVTEAEHDDHHRCEHRQHQRDDDPRKHRGLLDTGVVHRGQRDHGGHCHRVRPVRPHVVADCQRHRRTRRRLADDEAPPGGIAPELTEPLAPVDVGAAGLRIHRGQPSRRRRVAIGDHRCDGEPDEQTRACGGCCRAQRNEDARAHHRAQPDGHGVECAEPPLQRRAVRRAHAR
jgi:hypothetical protein